MFKLVSLSLTAISPCSCVSWHMFLSHQSAKMLPTLSFSLVLSASAPPEAIPWPAFLPASHPTQSWLLCNLARYHSPMLLVWVPTSNSPLSWPPAHPCVFLSREILKESDSFKNQEQSCAAHGPVNRENQVRGKGWGAPHTSGGNCIYPFCWTPQWSN